MPAGVWRPLLHPRSSRAESKRNQARCYAVLGLVLAKSRLGRAEQGRVESSRVEWDRCRGRAVRSEAEAARNQACLVSRVSFLAFPVWLGRAQLSVRSGEVDDTAVMLMAGLQVKEIRRGQRSAGARGWNRLDGLAIADGRAYRIEGGITLEHLRCTRSRSQSSKVPMSNVQGPRSRASPSSKEGQSPDRPSK